MPQTHNNSVSF